MRMRLMPLNTMTAPTTAASAMTMLMAVMMMALSMAMLLAATMCRHSRITYARKWHHHARTSLLEKNLTPPSRRRPAAPAVPRPPPPPSQCCEGPGAVRRRVHGTRPESTLKAGDRGCHGRLLDGLGHAWATPGSGIPGRQVFFKEGWPRLEIMSAISIVRITACGSY